MSGGTLSPETAPQRTDREASAFGSTPVLFLSNYFPPEVNALANRTWEHARHWAAGGGEIEVMAGPPHFPEGHVYAGYANRLTRERIDGVKVLRVPMYVTANAGFLRRTLSYVSYMISAAWYARRIDRDPGVVVASSPQFFAGLAGWLVSRRLNRPFVLEVRDLWPESIVDVGAMRPGVVIRLLERLESFLYRSADHVVIVSPAFSGHIEERGVQANKISLVPNGVDVDWFENRLTADGVEALREELGIGNRFVASYLGTVGMAHGVDVLLEAARTCSDPDVLFLVAGAGAEWQALHDRAARLGLQNLRVLAKQPRQRMPLFYGLSDVSLVLLRDRPAFRKVIPSKMFEAMATQRPVVLGVAGQAREILDQAKAGIAVRPGDPDDLLATVRRLKAEPALRRELGEAGARFVRENYDRNALADRYWELLQNVAASGRAP